MTDTYGGLSAEETREKMSGWEVSSWEAALLEALDHIDRLQRMIAEAQISNSNPPERQLPMTDGEAEWKASAEKAEAEQDRLREALRKIAFTHCDPQFTARAALEDGR